MVFTPARPTQSSSSEDTHEKINIHDTCDLTSDQKLQLLLHHLIAIKDQLLATLSAGATHEYNFEYHNSFNCRQLHSFLPEMKF